MDEQPRGTLPTLAGTLKQQLWADARRDWPIWLVGGVTLANGALAIISVLLVRSYERPELRKHDSSSVSRRLD
jgi:hypothetical protein